MISGSERSTPCSTVIGVPPVDRAGSCLDKQQADNRLIGIDACRRQYLPTTLASWSMIGRATISATFHRLSQLTPSFRVSATSGAKKPRQQRRQRSQRPADVSKPDGKLMMVAGADVVNSDVVQWVLHRRGRERWRCRSTRSWHTVLQQPLAVPPYRNATCRSGCRQGYARHHALR